MPHHRTLYSSQLSTFIIMPPFRSSLHQYSQPDNAGQQFEPETWGDILTEAVIYDD
jgi:hypothetical protein